MIDKTIESVDKVIENIKNNTKNDSSTNTTKEEERETIQSRERDLNETEKSKITRERDFRD
jgi:hypothetical protein